MHCFHFEPVAVLVRSESSHGMSAATVSEELEVESPDVEHCDTQGESGVTRTAAVWQVTRSRRRNRKERSAILDYLVKHVE